MSERVTNILGYLTLFAILGAIWVLFGEDPTKEQGARGERTFAGLEQTINNVARIKLRKNGAETVLFKSSGSWHIEQRSGYGADETKVRTFLRGIALSERREPKTSNQNRYEVIGLGDQALNVELLDDAGTSLLAFSMGKRKANAVSGRSLTYVFQPTDTRTWLVSELADAKQAADWWIDKTLVSVSETRVSDITLNGVWLTRKHQATDFKIQGVKANETVVPAWKLHDPVRVVSGLTPVDVKKLNNPLAKPFAKAVMNMYDGLVLTADVYEMDGGNWVKLSATYDETLRIDAPDVKAEDAVKAEIEQIMAISRGWAFKLSDADAVVLRSVRADFVSPKEADQNKATN